jgi:hypothetical protein
MPQGGLGEYIADNAPADFGDRAFPRSVCPGIPLRSSGRNASVAGEDVGMPDRAPVWSSEEFRDALGSRLCVDCIALLVMISADDKVTLAVFALTMMALTLEAVVWARRNQ